MLGRPQPRVVVFPGLEGTWFCREEEPVTGRYIFGLSATLYRRIRDELWALQDRKLEDLVDVLWVPEHDRALQLPVLPGRWTGVYQEPPADLVVPATIEIRHRKVGA